MEAIRYAESDKLGPLGTKRSILEDGIELRRMLVAEFQSAADAARDAASRVDKDAAAAVHDYRKALRRARAVLALAAGALPRSERRAILRALREARRALSPARDHAVVPDTVASVELDEVDRSTAATIISSTADSAPPQAEIKQLLAEGAARAAAQVEALEAS
ncbi:MAG TPA: CHAD domain-containing protein, partial [Kofleriaceae bacterium]|nr:CHAD domain-containing protein [Kofleriaceae bacterium]